MKLKMPSNSFDDRLARGPTVGASCWCFIVGFSEGYPDESGCRQGLAEIRTQWCKEHKDLDMFKPPTRNTLRPVWSCVVVCIPLGVVRCFGGVPARPYIIQGDRVTWKVLAENY
jgi:hypothetical protein